jgi:hypothetical protein
VANDATIVKRGEAEPPAENGESASPIAVANGIESKKDSDGQNADQLPYVIHT